MRRLLVMVMLLGSSAALAQSSTPKIDTGDTAFMILCSALVLLMTPGLAFFYGGLVRSRTVLNTMMMSFVAMGVVALLWAVLGYTLAFGGGGNAFIGGLEHLGLNDLEGSSVTGTIPSYVFFIFQLTFAVITPAIISGSLVDRMKFGSYVLFIALWSLLIYSPLAHMVWSEGGFWYKHGLLDFAGGTVIEVATGTAGLVAAMVLGKRSSGTLRVAVPHNIPFVLLGMGLLWFGWLGFNAGSALAANAVAAAALVGTVLAPAAAMCMWLLWEVQRGQKPSAVGAATGAVVGMVAITPACGYVSPMASIWIGLLASSASFWVVQIKYRINSDDALDVFACHGVAGFMGVLLTGVFASSKINPSITGGLLEGNPAQLLIQLEGALFAVAFVGVGTFVLMHLVRMLLGLRVTAHQESQGLDLSSHAEEGYTSGDFGFVGKEAGSIDSPVILNAND